MPNRFWPGYALPTGPRLLLWALRIGCVGSGLMILVGSFSPAYGQFPAPARPPKTATELPKGEAA